MEIGRNIGVSIWDSGRMPEMLQSVADPTALIYFAMYEFEYSSCGHTPGFEGLVDFINQKQIPMFILSGGYHKNKLFHDANNERYKLVQPVIYWSNFWMGKSFCELERRCSTYDINNLYAGTDETEYDYLFISMNAQTHYHRCLLLDLLVKTGLFDKGAISFRWREDETTPMRTNFYKWKYWQPKRLDLDDHDEGSFTSQGRIPIEYTRSFMQIVSESHHQAFFLTEKTCAPLFFNKPFLVSGCQGFHKMLEEMGFQLYTEIFDYSFDMLPNVETRNYNMLQNVVRLSKLSNSQLRELYIKISPKILYNRHHIQDLALDPYHVPPIVQHLYNFNDPCLNPDNGILTEYLEKILGQKN